MPQERRVGGKFEMLMLSERFSVLLHIYTHFVVVVVVFRSRDCIYNGLFFAVIPAWNWWKGVVHQRNTNEKLIPKPAQKSLHSHIFLSADFCMFMFSRASAETAREVIVLMNAQPFNSNKQLIVCDYFIVSTTKEKWWLILYFVCAMCILE